MHKIMKAYFIVWNADDEEVKKYLFLSLLVAATMTAILWQIKNPCYSMPTVALIMPFNGFLFVYKVIIKGFFEVCYNNLQLS